MSNQNRNLLKRALIIFVILFAIIFVIDFLHITLSAHDENKISLIISSVGISVSGLLVSIFTVRYIAKEQKKDLLGFTPYEIGMLFSEYKSLIEQLSEGIISVDEDFKITTLNDSFKKLFKLSDNHKGKDVNDVFPYINFEEIIRSGKQSFNHLIEIENEKVLLSTFPLYLDGKIIGATAIVRSRLEVDMLLDQISGYRKISKALREQKHEFRNKLHVIMGLIKMKDYEMVNQYISENIYTTSLVSDQFSSRIKDDKINALFVGKDIQSKEYNASIRLSDDSVLSKSHESIESDDLIIIIGNLIDNSLEAFSNKNIDNKKVTVKVIEDDSEIKISVSDNAGGIDPLIKDRMFKRGVSTKKGNSRGTGLSLVNEILTLYNGSKQVQSSKRNTYIEIVLKKVTK